MPYCLLMDALSKAGQIDEAKLVFSEMKRKNVKTGVFSWILLLTLKKKKQVSINMTSEVFECNYLILKWSPDGYAYSIMISAFCKHGLLEDAKESALEFEAKYEKYDVVILNTMLCAYCRSGEMENVMNLMKKMDELAINPDRNTFHILIKYFAKEKLYMLEHGLMHQKRCSAQPVGCLLRVSQQRLFSFFKRK